MSELHRKQKGNLGELAVAKQLVAKGFAVFTELGDNSRVDLIVLVENKPIKVQVKAVYEEDGVINVLGYKNGPNYSFSYEIDEVDVFAVYCIDNDTVYYLSSKILLQGAKFSAKKLRLRPPRNGQKKNITFASEFESFEAALNNKGD